MAVWRNTIKIKHLFGEDESDEKILEICKELVPQLKAIHQKEKGKIDDLYLMYLQESIENFNGIIEDIENNEDSMDYGEFETWCDVFNNELELLYQLGEVTIPKDGTTFINREKFIWID